eukprot:scaffold483_cov107-Isochrysis_galbana.AAC.13
MQDHGRWQLETTASAEPAPASDRISLTRLATAVCFTSSSFSRSPAILTRSARPYSPRDWWCAHSSHWPHRCP